MSSTTTYPFTTPGNYTYDAAKIAIVAGIAKLLDLTPANSKCGATYTTDINLNWGDGVLTGTAAGGAAVSGGKLDLAHSDVRYVDYDADGNADSQQTGAIKFKVTPNYTGSPAAAKNLFVISKASGADATNLIMAYHDSNGDLYVQVKDENNSNIVPGTSLGAWSPTSGIEYEFELNWDISSGATRLFIDGIQKGSTQTQTGIRSADINLLRIGANNTASFASNFKIDNLVVFSSVQHTANYTPGYTLPELKYDTSDPTIVTNSSFKSTELIDFSTTETVTGSDALKYIITASGQDRYVTGGSAANSDGTYSQSSTQAEMDSDITNIIAARKTVTVKSFLHSDDGSTTPELDLISLAYDAALEDATIGTILSNIESYIYDTNGPISSLDIEVRPFGGGFWNGDVFHKYAWETIATTDADGYFSGFVYVQPSGEFWEMRHGTKRYKFAIPSQAEVNLKDATTWEVIEI